MNKKKMIRQVEQAGEARSFSRIPLTAKQAAVLDFVKLHAKRYGFPPTRQEISDAFGFASANAAQQHLELIARKGHIVMQHAARGIILADPV